MAEVTTVESALLRLTGMRFCSEYEIAREGADCEIAVYNILRQKGEDERVRLAGIRLPASAVVSLFNRHGLSGWDGFVGPHPEDVLDGIMFRFQASVDGGKTIRAEGSENFPEGFSSFCWDLDALLATGSEN